MKSDPAVVRRPLVVVVACLAACLMTTAVTVGAGASGLATSSVWPRFSTPRTVFDVDATSLSSGDLLTATTLQGAYNGEQHPTRLYLNQTAGDTFWRNNGVPKGVNVVQIPPPSDGNVLAMLLQRFRPYITGAIVDDYAPGATTSMTNIDTVNLASTMAGTRRAIVVNPTQLALIQSLRIPVLYTFDPATFDPMTRAQTYQWAVDQWSAGGLLANASRQLLVVLDPNTAGGIRDYGTATGSFFYELTSTNSSEDAVIHEILARTPPSAPVMGYVPNENPDVADLSAYDHFLNGSNTLTNDSVWAAMPSPAALHQPTEPAPIAAQPDTVYVAFLVSDGDNADYMQNDMPQMWQDPALGSVPEGWTVAPGAVDFAPPLLQYFNDRLPANNELLAGPSGIGYATEMSGSALNSFVDLTNQVMSQDDLHTVDSFEAGADLGQYARTFDQPSISTTYPLVEQQNGRSVAFGQTNPYIQAPQTLFCIVHQQSETIRARQPLFIEPLVDGFTLHPTDLLHIAQQLALAGQQRGVNYVFTTPTELALTMQRYYAGEEAGLPAANAQSMTGAQVLNEPLVSGAYPTSPVQTTGPNLITNPSGASDATGWTAAAFPSATPNGTSTVTATTYEGAPALHWTDDITNVQSWAHYYPAVQNGDTYTFSVDVAGSGQMFLDAWSATRGAGDQYSLPVRLTPSFQRLTWTVTIPSYAPTGQTGGAPQLQLRESGVGPVSAYFRNASVEASNAAC